MRMRIAILSLLAVLGMGCATALTRPPLAVGLTWDYATKYRQHGFGMKFQAQLSQHLRFEPEMIYCNMHNDVATLHLNLNAHYLLPMTNRMTVYPFVGLSYSHWGYDGPNANRWGANLGAGLEYMLGRNWGVLSEIRFQAVKKESQLITALGVKYNF